MGSTTGTLPRTLSKSDGLCSPIKSANIAVGFVVQQTTGLYGDQVFYALYLYRSVVCFVEDTLVEVTWLNGNHFRESRAFRLQRVDSFIMF